MEKTNQAPHLSYFKKLLNVILERTRSKEHFLKYKFMNNNFGSFDLIHYYKLAYQMLNVVMLTVYNELFLVHKLHS